MTPESAYGAGFDALWIASAHDAAWPVSSQPNPFLPIALQRQFGIPAATNRDTLPRARQFTLAWLAAAPQMIVSYAAAAQDAPQAISPLFAHLPRTNEPVTVPAVAGGLLESLPDEAAPIAARGAYQGGAKIFKLQAACPFRAFAEMRLRATQLEEPYLGCSPRDHGSAIHKALEYCWSELGGSEALARMPHEDADALIERSVARALTERWSGNTAVHHQLREVEQRRLCRLLGQWLREERQRVLPFQVLAIEAEREANVNGVEIKVRADRVDRLDGGGLVILDYKTGMDVKARWSGERPEEPQLPLYAAMAEEPVAAVALAQIHPKSRKFIGQASSSKALPGKQAVLKPGDVDEWRHTMASLAQEFLGGHAVLTPGIETCRFCHLTSLCRKRDASGAEESDGG